MLSKLAKHDVKKLSQNSCFILLWLQDSTRSVHVNNAKGPVVRVSNKVTAGQHYIQKNNSELAVYGYGTVYRLTNSVSVTHRKLNTETKTMLP